MLAFRKHLKFFKFAIIEDEFVKSDFNITIHKDRLHLMDNIDVSKNSTSLKYYIFCKEI